MNTIGALYADEALRLANERLAGYRTDSGMDRLAASAKRRSHRFAGIRAALASLRATYSSVEPEVSLGLPTLRDYPYGG